MSLLITDKPPNIWEEVCKEFERLDPTREQRLRGKDESKVVYFDSSSVHPAVLGSHLSQSAVDGNPLIDYMPEIAHPAFIGLVDLPDSESQEEAPPKPLPDPKKCSPREYLDTYVFPVLLPGMLELLKRAGKEKCFERKFFRFNGCDFLTEYLYNNNPQHADTREYTPLDEISFVMAMNEAHPRKPLPWSLIWTEEEASLRIQSFWRGYVVRRQPDIQELRQYQRAMREEKEDIMSKVSDFWSRQEARSESRASAKSRVSQDNK